jgi:uncharacterized membrane protein YozB (DUF420 family)
MKNESSTNIFLEKYIYINYFLVFAFVIINLITAKEYRNIISTVFIIIMVPLLCYKINKELIYDKANGTKLVQKTLVNMVLIFSALVAIYFLV